MTELTEEQQKQVEANRLTIAQNLRATADALEEGSIRALALVAVDAQGDASTNALYVEPGKSSIPEMLGLVPLIKQLIAGMTGVRA